MPQLDFATYLPLTICVFSGLGFLLIVINIWVLINPLNIIKSMSKRHLYVVLLTHHIQQKCRFINNHSKFIRPRLRYRIDKWLRSTRKRRRELMESIKAL